MIKRLRMCLARTTPSPDPAPTRAVPPPLPTAKKASGIDRRIGRLEETLQALTEQQEIVLRQLRQIQAGVDGLVRAAVLDASQLPFPERLTARRFRLHSQNQEDGLLWTLFQEIGITDARFVELGSGASGGNAAMLAAECGWTGLMIEGNPESAGYARRRFPRVIVRSDWITPSSVNALLERDGFVGSLDLLSLDIDGNDYWVWEALTAASPRVVMLEYNSMFGPARAVTIPFDPAFNRREHRFCYYGASLLALTRLSARKGYRLVAVEPAGINAVFLRDDVGPTIPACDPVRAFRMADKYNALMRKKAIDVFQWAADTGRQLVEVP